MDVLKNNHANCKVVLEVIRELDKVVIARVAEVIQPRTVKIDPEHLIRYSSHHGIDEMVASGDIIPDMENSQIFVPEDIVLEVNDDEKIILAAGRYDAKRCIHVIDAHIYDIRVKPDPKGEMDGSISLDIGPVTFLEERAMFSPAKTTEVIFDGKVGNSQLEEYIAAKAVASYGRPAEDETFLIADEVRIETESVKRKVYGKDVSIDIPVKAFMEKKVQQRKLLPAGTTFRDEKFDVVLKVTTDTFVAVGEKVEEIEIPREQWSVEVTERESDSIRFVRNHFRNESADGYRPAGGYRDLYFGSGTTIRVCATMGEKVIFNREYDIPDPNDPASRGGITTDRW